ncbi:MAG: tRNA 2-thiouridine(34) synthase MnmA [Desulfamplus sp.]|nr:tRNA 2-thiouridine(34) synthase MnmA [Desulfamplus sp.]
MDTKKHVAVAVSGGVDSLVAAFLLKNIYPNLFGVHFTSGYEPVLKDEKEMSKSLEEQLNIPIYSIDLKNEFEKEVVSYFVETYKTGKTPNPCIICNHKIKFGALYQAAKDLGADLLATGHYANVISKLDSDIDTTKLNSYKSPLLRLLKGKDNLKDQSYFLAMLSSNQLEKAIFPLGGYTKQEVIAIAAQNRLFPIHKKESQDICFIPQNSFPDFILSKWKTANSSQTIDPSKSTNETSPFAAGDIVTTDNRVVGRHRGLFAYTVGQRRGLNCPAPAPYYVKKIDMEQNRLIVGFKEELFSDSCVVNNINWLAPNISTCLVAKSLKITTRIRYSHLGAISTLICDSAKNEKHESLPNRIKVLFDEPQLAVTPGQCAVFYDKDEVIGAGFIE